MTFGNLGWTTWWTTLPGLVVLLCGLLAPTFVFCFQLQMLNTGLLDISFRLHSRGIGLSLSAFLQRVGFSLETGAPLPAESDALHATLHRILAQVFQNRVEGVRGGNRWLIWSYGSINALAIVMYTVSARSLPIAVAL